MRKKVKFDVRLANFDEDTSRKVSFLLNVSSQFHYLKMYRLESEVHLQISKMINNSLKEKGSNTKRKE
jgi:hypothetical protein